MSKAPYKRLHTNEEYQQKIHEFFDMIGDDYDKPIDMIYIIKNPSASNSVNSNDDVEEEYEEPEKTFTSMNFVWKIIWEIPPNMFKFMTRPEQIRFIRLAKQRILKTLNTHIDFVSRDLGAKNTASKKLAATQRASLNDETFKRKLSKKIDKLMDENKITDKELYEDNDTLLQTYIDRPKKLRPPLPTPKGKKVTKAVAEPVQVQPVQVQPVQVAKPPPKPRIAKPKVKVLPQVEPVNKLSEYKKNSIAEFRIEMDDLDEADKLKHKEEDTPEILSGIDSLKSEFLNKFTRELNMIFEQDYDKEVQQLLATQLQFYAERLQDFRKGAHFKPNRRVQTRVKLRREGLKIMPPGTRVNQPNINVVPTLRKTPAVPKPRARAKTLKVNGPLNALPVVKTAAETNIEKYSKSVSAMFNTLNMSKLEKLAKKPTPRGVRKTAKMNTHPVEMLNKQPVDAASIAAMFMQQPKPRVTKSKNNAKMRTLNTRAGPVKAIKKITPKYLKVQP